MSAPRVIPTLVVTANGPEGEEILRMATEHAAMDPERRRVIRAEEMRPAAPASDSTPAILIIDSKGEICGVLDRRKASVEAWIEDAFLRAQSPKV